MKDPKNKKNLVDDEKIINIDEEIINNGSEDGPINEDESENSDDYSIELEDEPILPNEDPEEFF
jgi:hypothetical protein